MYFACSIEKGLSCATVRFRKERAPKGSGSGGISKDGCGGGGEGEREGERDAGEECGCSTTMGVEEGEDGGGGLVASRDVLAMGLLGGSSRGEGSVVGEGRKGEGRVETVGGGEDGGRELSWGRREGEGGKLGDIA